MKLVVLGSGTSVPHPKRSSSGYWLETRKGSILLDCSASSIYRMARENLDWANLDAIWISHFHLDHVGGLAPFLAGTRHATEMQDRKKPLKIFGAKGLRKLMESFDRANEYKLFKQPFPVEIIEVEPLETFDVSPELSADTMKTPHTAESLAIRIREDKKTFVYTADTSFDKTLRTFAKNADLFVVECSYFKNKPVKKHLELAEAMYLIRHAKPKLAVLTHLYPEWDRVDFKAEVAKFSPPCEVLQAEDGLTLSI